MDDALREEQLVRLKEAGITFSTAAADEYLAKPDIIDLAPDADVPEGYKRCGRCKKVKKLYLFNRNKQARTNCSGNCKGCQKDAASKSYEKNKGNRDYKAYYKQNKETKTAQSRKYYAEHKDEVLAKQKEYRGTTKGVKVMKKSHRKRKRLMAKNKGIPYTRAMVIDRDKCGGEFPICCLCNEPILVIDATLHMEHLIPIVQGGKDCFTNVACAHDTCNLTKSKDAKEITVDQVQTIADRAEAYIDAHPDLFPDLFSEN